MTIKNNSFAICKKEYGPPVKETYRNCGVQSIILKTETKLCFTVFSKSDITLGFALDETKTKKGFS